MTRKKNTYVPTAGDLVMEAEAIISFMQEATNALLNYTLQMTSDLQPGTPYGMELCFDCARERLTKAYALLERKGVAA